MTAAQVYRLAIVSGVAHGLGIMSVLVLFLGACGLAKNLATADRMSFAGIITFGLACIAVFVAATVSGFIVPALLKHMAQDAPSNAHPWQIVIDGIFQINQAFAEIYSVAASLAVILWSVCVLRNGGMSRGLAVYGCIISALIIIGISIGHLRLNVHGIAAVWFGQAIWFVIAGAQLCSTRGHIAGEQRALG